MSGKTSNKRFNFLGQFRGCLGIPNHTREFASAIIRSGAELNLVQITPSEPDPYGITDILNSNFTKPDPSLPSLMFWYPQAYAEGFKISGSDRKIGYYIFEYTKIPKQYIEEINKIDAICTASQWGRRILHNNGVTVPIHVVPGGVDPLIFNSKNRRLDTKRFRLLHIGKAENRKGTPIVIKAFNEAFKGDRKIRMSMFIDNPHRRDFNSNMFLHGLEKELNLKYSTDNIDIRHFEEDIVSIYNTHHAAVFASKAEGIGLPIVEAMACGLPTITPYNSGITEYANDDNSILLRRNEPESIYDPTFFPNAGEYGDWLKPSIEEMIEKMKWVYDNYSEATIIGNNAEKYMHENYTWDIAAKKIIEII